MHIYITWKLISCSNFLCYVCMNPFHVNAIHVWLITYNDHECFVQTFSFSMCSFIDMNDMQYNVLSYTWIIITRSIVVHVLNQLSTLTKFNSFTKCNFSKLYRLILMWKKRSILTNRNIWYSCLIPRLLLLKLGIAWIITWFFLL